jgi:4-hydroxyphenylpyruvate dioxygenase
MPIVAKADLSTGCTACASYVCQSHALVFAFTAPYGPGAAKSGGGAATTTTTTEKNTPSPSCPYPGYDRATAAAFVADHGLAVRAIGIVVEDAAAAHAAALAGGGVCAGPPSTVTDATTGLTQTTAAIKLYGDVLLRFVSGPFAGPFLAGYVPEPGAPDAASGEGTIGLGRLDHAVGNVPVLLPAANAVIAATGFHEFAEFVAADVGTVDSGLNSVVLANNDENVLLPINEPTFGTARPSQIQTFLDHHGGPGVQHLALKTDDAFATLRALRARTAAGAPGFALMPPASANYYKNLHAKAGDVLTAAQIAEAEELGLLVDRDDQGVLLQIFTRPLSDRPTVFLEIIQRVGCLRQAPQADVAARGTAAGVVDAPVQEAAAPPPADTPLVVEQAGGCGGFGKGNFSELFKSIEDYEKRLGV